MSRSVLVCACVLVLLTISVPQMEVNLPVRQAVTELGLLQGQCPTSSSGSGRVPASGFPSGDVSTSGLPQAQSGPGSGTGASASGSVSGSASGTGAGGSVSGSASGTGTSSSSGSASGTGASASSSSSGSASGTGASAGGSSSGSPESGFSGSSSGSGVPVVFRNRRNAEGSAVSASGSGSGSGDICSSAFEILGPFCARVLEVQLCQFNFSLQTCNLCTNLLSSCGQPMGNISTLCASQRATSCLQSAGLCLDVQFADSTVCDYCAFVGSRCYQRGEFELCSVNGLVDGCTSILRGTYECECFLPSSQCSFCRNLIRVCATTIPVSV